MPSWRPHDPDLDPPVIHPGQLFAVTDDAGNTTLQETLIPSGKKKPAVAEQICLSLPVEETP